MSPNSHVSCSPQLHIRTSALPHQAAQHLTLLSVSNAHEWEWPTAIETTSAPSAVTVVGVARLVVSPSPSWPSSPRPHEYLPRARRRVFEGGRARARAAARPGLAHIMDGRNAARRATEVVSLRGGGQFEGAQL